MSQINNQSLTADQVTAMSVRQAREAIDQINDITLLDRIIDMEEAGKARKSLIGFARLRVDGLRESGEAEISVDEDPGLIGITLPSGITIPASSASIQLGGNRAEGEEPVEAQEAPVEPEAAPAEVQVAPKPEAVQEAPVEPEQGSSVDDCARAFFAALRQGNTALVAALLAEVRREDADDAAMAEALVKAHSEAPARRSAGNASASGSKPSKLMTDRIDRLIAIADQHNGEVTTDQMLSAGVPKSWTRHAANWARTSGPQILMNQRGYRARLVSRNGDKLLTVTRS